MLVVEKDNIVIDVNNRHSQHENYGWLVFEATLHINGKLKRTSFDVRVSNEEKLNCVNSCDTISKSGYYLVDWNDIYGPIKVIESLGYDLGKTVNDIVKESLDHYNGIVNTREVGEIISLTN